MVRKLLFIVVTVSVLLALTPAHSALAADSCTLTIAASGATAVVGDASNTERRVGQSFIVTSTGILTEFRVQEVANSGSPTGPIYWEVRGSLTGTILKSGSFTAAPNTQIVESVTSGPLLAAGNTYVIIFYADAQATNTYYGLRLSSSSVYADGTASTSANGGASWSNITQDLDLGIVTDGLCSTPTPTAFVSPTPTTTPTPTVTPSPAFIIIATYSVTEMAGYPVVVEPSASFGEITVTGLLIVLIGLVGVFFASWIWRRR